MRSKNFTRRNFIKTAGSLPAVLSLNGCFQNTNALPFKTLDMSLGEHVHLQIGRSLLHIRLGSIEDEYDSVCDAVRCSTAHLEINGKQISIDSGNYNLPVVFQDIKIDCPITKSYYCNTNSDRWGLKKDIRLRIWPKNSHYLQPGTFKFPVEQKWFASDTQMSNEPVYVDGGEKPGPRKIYYHSGLDFGGAEDLVKIVSATDGLVVSARGEILDDYKVGTPIKPRTDVVYILDHRGWFYRYSHMSQIDHRIQAGDTVKLGDEIGLLGKAGASGGWSHLHFEIISKQPSGLWGTQEGYPFIWEAYVNEYKPALLAVARPHRVGKIFEKIHLDATKSWARNPEGLRYEWILSNGQRSLNKKTERIYTQPGVYTETLKLTDARGNTGYDFCRVLVFDIKNNSVPLPNIHAAFWPTRDIKVGQPIIFKTRSFTEKKIGETWEFGDNSKPITVMSDGNIESHAENGYAQTQHRYNQPGDYIARVSCKNQYLQIGTNQLFIKVRS